MRLFGKVISSPFLKGKNYRSNTAFRKAARLCPVHLQSLVMFFTVISAHEANRRPSKNADFGFYFLPTFWTRQYRS
jgi:hypothetical protein